MPYIDNSLAVAEQRVRDLKAKLELRRSQLNEPTNDATAFGRFPAHMQSLYRELAAAAAVVVTRYDPLEVLDKMGFK